MRCGVALSGNLRNFLLITLLVLMSPSALDILARESFVTVRVMMPNCESLRQHRHGEEMDQ